LSRTPGSWHDPLRTGRSVSLRQKLDFRRLQKYDLTGLIGAITKKVNERFAAEVLQEVLVEEFNYVAKGDIKG
jgi:hypothetical protein